MKKFFIVFLSILLILTATVSASAAEFNTYADLNQSSSTAQNLLALAMNHDSFSNSDYVISQTGTYSYSIFWSKSLDYSSDVVSGTDVHEIRYYRTGDYGSSYQYINVEHSTFSLTVFDIVVSNIDSCGMVSHQYEESESDYFILVLIVIAVAFLFALWLIQNRK